MSIRSNKKLISVKVDIPNRPIDKMTNQISIFFFKYFPYHRVKFIGIVIIVA